MLANGRLSITDEDPIAEPNSEVELETTTEQLQCVNDFRHWVENEAEFYGRTDEEFLLMYLRGCIFNLEKTKKKLKAYYESRKKLPKWWANRDLTDRNLLSLAELKVTTVLMDKEPDQPTVLINRLARIGPNLGNFDHYIKLNTIILDIAMRRRNCQLNGLVWILDYRDYPFWYCSRMVSPFVAKNMLNSYYSSTPVRIKKMIMLNVPVIGVAFVKLLQPFVSQKLKQRLVLYGSNWPTLSEHLPIQLIPEEYGGTAGPMEQHDDAFLEEIVSYTDYIAEDNKYGFK